MVFANAGMFDREFGDDAAPYVVAAVVGGLLWRVVGQLPRTASCGCSRYQYVTGQLRPLVQRATVAQERTYATFRNGIEKERELLLLLQPIEQFPEGLFRT